MALGSELLARIEMLRIRAGRVVEGLGVGTHASRMRGRNVEFAEHREYAPGDDPRLLDWRLHAKSDRYYVRESEAETDLEVRLLVDASASMSYRSPNAVWSKYECAATLAAALATIVLRQRDGVGLTVFNDSASATVPVSRRPSHVDQIVSALANCSPAGRGSFAEIAPKVAPPSGRRGMVILLSDLFDAPEIIAAGCRRLAHARQEVSLLQIVDRAECDFPFDEPLVFADLEGAGSRQADGAAIAAGYHEEFRRHVERVRSACHELNCGYRLSRTDEPPERILSEFLARPAIGRRPAVDPERR